ncbi:acyltransferase family protein [Polluticoccus soli]|uniref:acyltransferase family protein n=1 Tax=Polluticoccus soli TaxID=3034150 RepID=UPI0023E08F94|nr:acyltransferase [Flavipsychrobacter sp. JY13-12]
MSKPASSKRIYGLDILRAAAILFVMQSHSLTYLEPIFNVHYYWLFILDGVSIFFVLSGFLIGGILIKTIDNNEASPGNLWQFWIRRWFRTLPNYFLILLMLLPAYRYAFGQFPDKALQFFSFTQNFASPHPDFFGEAWSLSVEEWFYLLVPAGLFLLTALAKAPKRLTILSWICFVLVSITCYRLYTNLAHPEYFANHTWDRYIRKTVLTRMDSIMFGVLGAYLCYYFPKLWNARKNALFIAGILLLFGARIMGTLSDFYYQHFDLSVQAIGVLLLLPKLRSISTGKGPAFRFLSFISVISYSMYLLNFTIVQKVLIAGILKVTGANMQSSVAACLLAYTLFWSLTIGLAYLLYRFYERPMMNLRERFASKTEEPMPPADAIPRL